MLPLHSHMHGKLSKAAMLQGRVSPAWCSTSVSPLLRAKEHQRLQQRGGWVICMASERRVARVSKQLEREIGALLQGDPVVQTAICPERRAGFDSSLSALASVTEVRLSSDLQVAKIYLSVYSDAEGKASALQGLSKLQGYVRTKLAGQMRLRSMPEIRFMNDDAAEKGEQVLLLLEKIKRQNAGEEDLPPIAVPPLRKSQGLEGPRKSRPSREDELTEDGFLDLDGSEEAEEGFLLRDEAIHDGEALAGGSLIEEDSLLDEDDIEEDDEEYEEASGDVIDQYLGGKEDSSNELMDPSYYGIPADTGKRNQRKSRRKKS